MAACAAPSCLHACLLAYGACASRPAAQKPAADAAPEDEAAAAVAALGEWVAQQCGGAPTHATAAAQKAAGSDEEMEADDDVAEFF
jgi:hypothetical protein